MASGSCLCASVRYRVDGPLRDVVNCHCERCRRVSGVFLAATAAARADLTIDDATGTLAWYSPAAEVSYGFCRRCGSTLFWRSADRPAVWSIIAGTLDQPTGLTTTLAIHTAAAADFHVVDERIASHAGELGAADIPFTRADPRAH